MRRRAGRMLGCATPRTRPVSHRVGNFRPALNRGSPMRRWLSVAVFAGFALLAVPQVASAA